MIKFYFWLKNRQRNRRIKRAIIKANIMFSKSLITFYVLWYRGKPLIKSKKALKQLIKEGFFKKGLTLQDIEKMAIYRTHFQD